MGTGAREVEYGPQGPIKGQDVCMVHGESIQGPKKKCAFLSPLSLEFGPWTPSFDPHSLSCMALLPNFR